MIDLQNSESESVLRRKMAEALVLGPLTADVVVPETEVVSGVAVGA